LHGKYLSRACRRRGGTVQDPWKDRAEIVQGRARARPGINITGMASPGASILIVDDDPHIREVLRYALGREGYRTLEAGNGAEALEAFDRGGVDLVILDILMPEMDGTEVCRSLRARSRVPLIFLTSKDDEVDRIVGLELGGDDYVTKPFSPKELVARVRAVLRRAANAPGVTASPPASGATAGAGSRRLRHAKMEIDLDRCLVFWDGKEIALTATELGLLQTLAARPGHVFSREELMRQAYEGETHVSGRTIDSHVRRLRAKFLDAGGEPIVTVHGIGYKLGDCA
jgi:two-component system OmpR family response regulator